MARANRHHLPGYVWHITHRCHKREFLLKFDKDKKRWIHWLFEAKKRFVHPDEAVEFDYLKRETRFGKQCSDCGSHSYVIGASPCFLVNEIMKSGIYRTDLEFGDVEDCGATFTPEIILTEDLLQRFLEVKATGLDYEETSC